MLFATDTTLMAQSEQELNSLLREVKDEIYKAGFKFNIQRMKIISSGPIISWHVDEETIETVTDFIFLGPQITAAMKLKDTCSLEEKLWQTQ